MSANKYYAIIAFVYLSICLQTNTMLEAICDTEKTTCINNGVIVEGICVCSCIWTWYVHTDTVMPYIERATVTKTASVWRDLFVYSFAYFAY